MGKVYKRVAFASVLFLILFAVLEVFSFLTGLVLHDDLFSNERRFLTGLEPADLAHTLRSPHYSPELGWDIPEEATSVTSIDCRGHEVAADTSDHRARHTVGLEGEKAQVALFGDSYAHGDEVSDEQTIASVLTQKYNIPTLNFGVTAYGPTQAYLKFERERPLYRFHTAVLLIMHENIRRAVNSFRPIIAPNTENKLTFKPYTRDGRIFPNTPLSDWDTTVQNIKDAFRNDFWATPRFRFPYSISLIRAMLTPNFHDRVSNKLFGAYSYEYSPSSPLLTNLETVIDRFVDSAKANGIRPLVVFVPMNKSTHLVARRFADRMNAELGDTLVFDLDLTGIDWKRYNVKPNLCHPSVYGYSALADRLATLLQ